jgi:hypothetical protein
MTRFLPVLLVLLAQSGELWFSGGVSILAACRLRRFGIPLIRGRLFDERDRMHAPMTAVIEMAAVRRLFPMEIQSSRPG